MDIEENVEADPTMRIIDGIIWRKQDTLIRVWVPRVDDSLICDFVGFKQRVGAYGPYTIAIVRDGEQLLSIAGNELIRYMEAADLKYEQLIRIVYLGTAETMSGATRYHKFQLFVANGRVKQKVPRKAKAARKKTSKKRNK